MMTHSEFEFTEQEDETSDDWHVCGRRARSWWLGQAVLGLEKNIWLPLLSVVVPVCLMCCCQCMKLDYYFIIVKQITSRIVGSGTCIKQSAQPHSIMGAECFSGAIWTSDSDTSTEQAQLLKNRNGNFPHCSTVVIALLQRRRENVSSYSSTLMNEWSLDK